LLRIDRLDLLAGQAGSGIKKNIQLVTHHRVKIEEQRGIYQANVVFDV